MVRATLLDDRAQSTVQDVIGDAAWLSRPSQPEGEIAFITGRMSEYQLREKLEVLGNLVNVQSVIRVLDY